MGVFLATVLTLTNLFGSVTLETHGARVTSYVPAGGSETLRVLPSGTGGWMLCWPWFGGNKPCDEAPRHGLVRYREFEVVSRCTSEIVLRQVSDSETRKVFPHDWSCTVAIGLDEKGLTVSVTGENTGQTPFAVTEAMHPYFRVSTPQTCQVTGLPEPYVVQGGPSRVFPFATRAHVYRLEDAGAGRTFSCASSGDIELAVWNPGEKGHLSKSVTSLGPEDWKTFVCVENGTLTSHEAYVLKPGEKHLLSSSLTITK